MLQSRLQGNTMAVDAEQRELLETYAEVVKFFLCTYATDEVIPKRSVMPPPSVRARI